MGERLSEIKEEVDGIQMFYDIEGYVSTNTADRLIGFVNELIQLVQVTEKENIELKGSLNAIGNMCVGITEFVNQNLGGNENE